MMTVLSSNEETKAKKDHICDFCSCKIQSGSKYLKSTLIYDGIYDWKTHPDCEWVAQELKMYEQCDYGEGLTGDHFSEIVADEFNTLMNNLVPKDSNSDVFWAFKNVNWRQQLGYVIRHYKKLQKDEQ